MSVSDDGEAGASSSKCMKKKRNARYNNKPDPNKGETRVRHTGDWSSNSKLSAIHNGYWEDPFFKLFNPADPSKIRRTSLICRGYYVRFRVCDFFLRNTLRAINNSIQIVSIGSGLDTTYFRLLPEFDAIIDSFYELDFKSVIAAKKSIILHSDYLRAMAKETLFLLPCDLRDISTVHEALRQSNFDFQKPTLFYSECVVNYLQPHESNRILHWITENVPNSIWLAYEQCHSTDAFGEIMVSHFVKNDCALHSLLAAPDPASQIIQLENANFEAVGVYNSWDVFSYIGTENPPHFPQQIQRTEHQFDEYEVFVATCLHYTIRVGCTGDLGGVSQFFLGFRDQMTTYLNGPKKECSFEHHVIGETRETEDFSLTISSLTNMPKLSGHKAVVTKNNTILTFGGSGENSVRMKHLIKSEFAFNTTSEELDVNSKILIENPTFYERIYTAAVYFPGDESGLNNSVFVFGGRKSPLVPCGNELIGINLENLNVGATEKVESIIYSQSHGLCPEPRWRSGLVLFIENSVPVLVLFGGRNCEKIFGDSWWYNIEQSEWQQKFVDSEDITKLVCEPTSRHSHSMTSDKDHIFIVGGVSEDDTTLCKDSILEYRCEWNGWKNLEEYNFFCRRIGHSVLLHNRSLIIVGGYAVDTTLTLQHFVTIIHLEPNVVRTYDFTFPPQQRFLPCGFAACIVKDSTDHKYRVIISGGGGNCFSFGSHYNQVCAVLTLKWD